MTKSKTLYRGILAEPIVAPPSDLFTNSDFYDAVIKAARIERLKALYENFKIPMGTEDSKDRLIEVLALAHVPGFSATTPSEAKLRKGGRTRKWTHVQNVTLVAQVDEHMAKGKTARSACDVLRKKSEYRHLTLLSLYRHYLRAKKTAAATTQAAGYGHQILREWGYTKESAQLADLSPKQRAIGTQWLRKNGIALSED